MIDANTIDERKQRAKPIDPPRISRSGERIPLVMRVSPELAGRTEIVRRYSCKHGGLAAGIEPEQLTPRPDVGAVVRDEDRQVAHDLNRSRMTGVAHAAPLLEEQVLRQLVLPDFPGAANGPAGKGRR